MILLVASMIFPLALVHTAAAHYCFPYLMVNETISPIWKYVRRSLTNDTISKVGQGSFPPMYDLNSEDIRCGRNSTGSGPESDIAVVDAGSKVGFRPDLYAKGFCKGCAQPQLPYLHDGPLFVYLSSSPEQSSEGLQRWDGDGDWFKIAEKGPDNDISWWWNSMHDNVTLFNTWNFTIPRATPPGFYLMRIESIYPKPTYNKTQFYASCAQVQILGAGDREARPGPTVKFPGAFDYNDPGILIPANLSGHLTEYQMPGPSLWSG